MTSGLLVVELVGANWLAVVRGASITSDHDVGSVL